ncbi:MAG: hypothetical protein ACD_23C00459G0002 [uncultured bacterium]|nr:MAG: hypothetical protein ACD_23C00459G0002 [uncultured bacterium]
MNFIFRSHAIKRMFERSVGPEDMRHVPTTGKTIREYPDDTSYPSRLILGWVADKPLHVVVAVDAGTEASIIITVYEPDPTIWEADFKRKEP